MAEFVELQCEACEDVIAHVQLVPENLLIHGAIFCVDCFNPDIDEDEE